MTTSPILRLGHPTLRARAAPIADPTAPDVARLAADMVRTLRLAGGAGLAAPQIAVEARVILVSVPPGRGEEGEEMTATILVNPVVEALDRATAVGWEACLSIPGLRGAVARHRHIGYRGFGLDGQPIEREAAGFHARIVQHEVDHLDGVLYIDRMPDLTLLGFEEEARHLARLARERSFATGI